MISRFKPGLLVSALLLVTVLGYFLYPAIVAWNGSEVWKGLRQGLSFGGIIFLWSLFGSFFICPRIVVAIESPKNIKSFKLFCDGREILLPMSSGQTTPQVGFQVWRRAVHQVCLIYLQQHKDGGPENSQIETAKANTYDNHFCHIKFSSKS